MPTETILTILNSKTGEEKTFSVKARWLWLARLKYVLKGLWWMGLRHPLWEVVEVKTNDPILYADFKRTSTKKGVKCKVEWI